MNSILICHDNDLINLRIVARWLASFSNLSGIVVLQERRTQSWRRMRREVKRVGLLRFIDVVAFRLYYRLILSRKDQKWRRQCLERFCARYPEIPKETPFLYTHSPNSGEAEQFIRNTAPDVMIARCKVLLTERIFSIPSRATLVMHPGICPEYRNSHGCFWALANDDLRNVGMTLLKIDKGVDTGPVYGYYTSDFDEVNESHVVIQTRVVLENLERIKEKIVEIHQGRAVPISTVGRRSSVWGQPWLTRYMLWKHNAKKRREIREGNIVTVP
jgi:hypothetical protein